MGDKWTGVFGLLPTRGQEDVFSPGQQRLALGLGNIVGQGSTEWVAREGLKVVWQKGKEANTPAGGALLAAEPDVGTWRDPKESLTQGCYRKLLTAIEVTFLWCGMLGLLQPREKALVLHPSPGELAHSNLSLQPLQTHCPGVHRVPY